MFYGLPEGAFESMRNNKDPAGIVVVWETTSCQSARPGSGGDGSVLALIHLPRYARAHPGVILPPFSFCSSETLFFGSFDHRAARFLRVTRHRGSGVVDVTMAIEDRKPPSGLEGRNRVVRKRTPGVRARCMFSIHGAPS